MALTKLRISDSPLHDLLHFQVMTEELDHKGDPVFRDATDDEIDGATEKEFDQKLEDLQLFISHPMIFENKEVYWGQEPNGVIDVRCTVDALVVAELTDEEIEQFDMDSPIVITRAPVEPESVSS